MFDWLKKFGGNQPWQNKAGLDKKSLELLVEDFKALENVDAELFSATLRYVLDGDGDEVLLRLSKTQGVDTALRLGNLVRGVKAQGQDSRMLFFDGVRCTDQGLFIRLGKIYDAGVKQKVASQIAQLGQFAQLAAPLTSQLTSQLSPQSFADPSLDWLAALLMEGFGLATNVWPRRCRSCRALDAGMVEAMLTKEGHPPSLLIRTAFQPPLQQFGPSLESIFQQMSGLGDSAVRHKETLLQILDHADFKQRVYALKMMGDCKVPLEPFLEKLVESSIGSSKLVREQAWLVLVEKSSAARPLLEEKIRNGENEERVNAAQLLWRWEGSKARVFLEAHLGVEKNKKVIGAIRELIDVPAEKPADVPADDALLLPALGPIPDRVPLGAETEKAWQECFEQVNCGIMQVLATNKRFPPKNLKTVSGAVVRQAFGELAGGKCGSTLQDIGSGVGFKEVYEPLTKYWQRPELQPVHLVRFFVQTGLLQLVDDGNRYYLFVHWLEVLLAAYYKAHPEFGLRELGVAFAAAGLDPARIGKGLLSRYGSARGYGLSRERIWPYWMEHLEVLENAFGPAPGDFMARYYQREARARAFEVLASFPKTPARMGPLLWNLALGPKSERPLAQRCLESFPDKMSRLIPALAAGSAETRLAAADWLGRLGDKGAVEALLTALKREKNESAKAAMMLALEQLGVPVDQFLDRAILLKEAEKAIAREIAEDLKWFPFDLLPAVHWEDTGKQVQPAIIRWWIVQGFKLKTPEPGALLRRYCASIKASEREALGQFILEAWIAEDTAPIARDEAEKRAKAHAQSMAHFAQYTFQHAQTNPQGATLQPPLTAEQYFAQALPNFLKQPKGSAIASKGVLSVAGGCVGASAAPVINRYLKEWYGQRAAHCKALLQMLSWVEHRTATQLMLAVGSRFRTKSIQEEANKLAQALADRKGWTIAELADRTIPSAGLDEDGVLTIDFGPRQFTAKLNEDLEFVLSDAEGKVLKSLPDPRKDDDEARAVEAKKMFSGAKKELKSVVTMQRDRFYEAMCTQRTWDFDDWNLYLNQHPIVRHHCQRLVWSVIQNEKAVRLFRPLADGSLTDVADDPVDLKGDVQIRVAHECQVTAEESKLWRQHLKDYDVESLFEQFGRPNFDLSEERKGETEMSDFQGHVLEAFKLRGRASKLGYTRGQAQDGGWFYEYHKRFPTLGIEATIEFTGNGLPEENRTVSLTNLHFARVSDAASGGNQEKMMLSEVPSVLLSECWNDIRTIAAEGLGFDPDWEKKTQP